MWPFLATKGTSRRVGPPRAHTMEGFFMAISRRFFLIGSGAVVTAAFVKDAERFVERRSRPLLIKPDRVETELFYYDGYGDGDAALITLGQWVEIEDVAAPTTWREYYTRVEGFKLDSQAQL